MGLRATSQSRDTVQHGAGDIAGIFVDYIASLLSDNLMRQQADYAVVGLDER